MMSQMINIVKWHDAVNRHHAHQLRAVADTSSPTLSKSPTAPAPQLNSDLLAALISRHPEWVARDTPRRAVGCSVVLLPEEEAKLTEEIAYHEATRRIMPRARRQNTVNPRIPYRRKPS